ncbi:MAG: hypothetical protein ISR55_13265 [Bacteroidetes bacterium]|nr:hypothetical protein [Bacteroidota bacterium]MBL6964785.1 hypothetical protein [Bacteroidota bacterium]
MKTLINCIGIILFLLPVLVKAEAKEIPFTLEDRDRIIRTEQKVEALQTEMNVRFEAFDNRFDQLFNFLWVIIGVFSTMMISVFGFAFWDRKLSLAPLKKQDQKILSVLIDLAKSQPKLSESLKNAGLL